MLIWKKEISRKHSFVTRIKTKPLERQPREKEPNVLPADSSDGIAGALGSGSGGSGQQRRYRCSETC